MFVRQSFGWCYKCRFMGYCCMADFWLRIRPLGTHDIKWDKLVDLFPIVIPRSGDFNLRVLLYGVGNAADTP